jgi:hypothetical protein
MGWEAPSFEELNMDAEARGYSGWPEEPSCAAGSEERVRTSLSAEGGRDATEVVHDRR